MVAMKSTVALLLFGLTVCLQPLGAQSSSGSATIELRPSPQGVSVARPDGAAIEKDKPVTLKHSPAPEPIQLWSEPPEEPEGWERQPESLAPDKGDGVARINHVSDPNITVYRPVAANGTAVVVCPGGGYNILAIEHEGTQVCSWLNSIGVTAALLKYRVPRRDKKNPSRYPLADAQQAIRLIRKRAADWGVQPDRIGILGFSAGGNLAVLTALHSEGAAKPDFAVPVYPAYLTKDNKGDALLPEIKVTDESPPMCFIHAGDDRITSAGSALLYLELKKRDIPAELHIYAKGGHGFGMKANGQPVNDWPARVTEWFNQMGWLD